MANAATIAAHNVTDAAEAASIGARVDSKTGKWYSLADGHYIGPAEADTLLGRTTAQGNADRAQGNGGGFTDQLVARNQGSVSNFLKNNPITHGLGTLIAPGGGVASDLKDPITKGEIALAAGAAGPAAAGLGAGAAGAGAVAAGAKAAANSLPGSAPVNGAPSSSPPGGGGNSFLNTVTGLLPTIATIGGAANAADLQAKSQQYADDAVNQIKGDYASTAPLRSAGIAGLLNPSTPAPGLPALQALNTAASKGNPFATAVPLPGGDYAPGSAPPATSGLPSAAPVSSISAPPTGTTATAVNALSGGSGGPPPALLAAVQNKQNGTVPPTTNTPPSSAISALPTASSVSSAQGRAY